MRRVLLGLSLVTLWSCVDATQLAGFECDSAGNCKPPSGSTTGSGGGTTGGGSTTGGGNATGGGTATGGGGVTGGGGGVTGGGGGEPCNSSNCTGCCDANGQCSNGDQNTACGANGGTCSICNTGERCQASACQPLQANGGSCSLGTECASGFCVGGFCCNGSCSGACETCSAVGNEGRCTPLAEATVVAQCGAYSCDGVNGICPTTCTSTRNCSTGRFCDNGQCDVLRAQGVACTASAQCQSGFCADGLCCNSACSGSCDRCNLAGTGGTCTPAPANDPGSPACGGSVVCNGTLADCPILCTSGCPMSTYCSGMYCAAKKPNGVQCGAANECTSSNCVDGVCCDTACGGNCDACSVANGAAVDGTCALLGPSRICRGSTSSCDVEERCSGTSATCGGDGFADAGVSCGTTSFTAWSACDGGTSCATSGVQTRTRTDRLCTGSGTACGMNNTSESQACTRTTDGTSCGTTTYGSYTACNYALTCSNSGSRTRPRTDPLCQTGTCAAVQNTETDTAGCARNTDTTSCGTVTFGSYTACTFAAMCSETGSRTRPRTDPLCQSGSCANVNSTETDTSGCTRTTGGQPCNTTSIGNWSACSYATPCSNSGSRTRTVTSYACGSGTCNPSTMTETDTTACARNTDTNPCGTTTYGNYTACSYGSTCTNSGSRTRPMTTFTCSAGTCMTGSGTDTDTAGCARDTSGMPCRGAAGLCDAAEACSAGACPADVFLPAGTVCRSANATICDFSPEVCSGSSISCPANSGGCGGTQHCCAGDGCFPNNVMCP